MRRYALHNNDVDVWITKEKITINRVTRVKPP